jgi:AcrR family transcriptional regulator
MSAPAKTSEDEIVASARRLLEDQGLEALTMQAVAREVGVRPPSLYKRYESRADLLRAVLAASLEELRQRVEQAAAGGKPKSRLMRMAWAYREFAYTYPNTYDLIYSRALPPGADPGDDARTAVSKELIAILREHIVASRLLPSARLLVGFLHGFVSLELSGAFRLGGNLDDSFEIGLRNLLASLLPDIDLRLLPR